MGEKNVRRSYKVRIKYRGSLIYESEFLSLEEIDKETSKYEKKDEYILDKGIKYPSNSVSLEIWYIPNKEKEKTGTYGHYDRKSKRIDHIVYEQDQSIFNREYILDKFNSHTLDRDFVEGYITEYLDSSEALPADLAAQIKNSLHDYSKYKPTLDKLIYVLYDGYLHYRKMYFFMKNYERYLEEKNKGILTKRETTPKAELKVIPPTSSMKKISSKEVRGGRQIPMSFLGPQTDFEPNSFQPNETSNNPYVELISTSDEELDDIIKSVNDVEQLPENYRIYLDNLLSQRRSGHHK